MLRTEISPLGTLRQFRLRNRHGEWSHLMATALALGDRSASASEQERRSSHALPCDATACPCLAILCMFDMQAL